MGVVRRAVADVSKCLSSSLGSHHPDVTASKTSFYHHLNGNTNGNTNTNGSQDFEFGSLRRRLEHDMDTALNISNASAAASKTKTTRSSSSSRLDTASVATRLAQSVHCSLEEGTPRYLETAMKEDLNGSPQCRLIVTAEPPHRVVYASPSWKALTGFADGQAYGRPALSVLVAGKQVTSHAEEGVNGLVESLHMHCKGCATVACRSSSEKEVFPARLTVSPLLDTSGDVSHMLCCVHPL